MAGPSPDEPFLASLEARLVFAMIVAGKTAKFATQATRRLLEYRWKQENTFAMIRRLDDTNRLAKALHYAGTGNYEKLWYGLRQLARAEINLRTCTPQELERIHGIGPKTARFFVLWTRPQEEYAALDTHVLRWLRRCGYEAPKATPSGQRYRELERAFIEEARKRAVSPRELDHAIWVEATGHPERTQWTRELVELPGEAV